MQHITHDDLSNIIDSHQVFRNEPKKKEFLKGVFWKDGHSSGDINSRELDETFKRLKRDHSDHISDHELDELRNSIDEFIAEK
jgi:hypothetical protein